MLRAPASRRECRGGREALATRRCDPPAPCRRSGTETGATASSAARDVKLIGVTGRPGPGVPAEEGAGILESLDEAEGGLPGVLLQVAGDRIIDIPVRPLPRDDRLAAHQPSAWRMRLRSSSK